MYEAARLTDRLKKPSGRLRLQPGTRPFSADLLGALNEDNGFEEIASWSYPAGSDTIETHMYQIDHERFAIDPHQMFISPEALDRLAGMLEREPDEGSRAAAALLSRIVRRDGSLDAGLARLEHLAGRSP